MARVPEVRALIRGAGLISGMALTMMEPEPRTPVFIVAACYAVLVVFVGLAIATFEEV
jgi:hypothetical protein